MELSQQKICRMAGLCGVAGGLVFFIGDMLMYGHFGAGTEFVAGMRTTVQQAPLWRLTLGGLVGPLAACLCIMGFYHVYLSMKVGIMRAIVLVLGAVSMMVFGAIHILWVAGGLVTRHCGELAVSCSALKADVSGYWNTAYYLGAVPGYLASVILLVMILMRRTDYPRWAVLLNPAVTFLITPLFAYVPAPLGAPLVGGDANLMLALFFFVCVAVTWRNRNEIVQS